MSDWDDDWDGNYNPASGISYEDWAAYQRSFDDDEASKMSENRVISVTDAAKRSGFNRSYIKAEIAHQRLAATKNATGGYEIREEDFLAWLDQPQRGNRGGSVARRLVASYFGFYRADDITSERSCVRPLNVLVNALADALSYRLDGGVPDERADALYEIGYGTLHKFMQSLGRGHGKYGFYPKESKAGARDEAVQDFVAIFLRDWFLGAADGDPAMLRSKQMQLLRSACATIYRELRDSEWRQRRARQAEEGAFLDDSPDEFPDDDGAGNGEDFDDNSYNAE